MYAIKGAWIGQTFALATCNESGGRKARIRRSKEERKAMVESFIKTYQSSNDGKFPSLNLTHKEVGGSFYTVREIVRDIIQENRVLGPAKFSSEKQKFDGNKGEFPLESAAMDPQDYLFQIETENPAVIDQQASAIMEQNINEIEQYAEHVALDAVETEESDKLTNVDSLVTESVDNYIEPELVGASTDYHGNMSMELEVTESITIGNYIEPELVGASTGYHGNMSMEMEFQGNKQLDKDEDLDAEQLENVGSIEGYGEVMVSTDSSICDSFVVEKEAALEVTKWQENANLELKGSDNEQWTKHDRLDYEKYVDDRQVEESDKLNHVESPLIDKHEVVRNPGLVEANTMRLSNPIEDIVVETFPMRSATKDIYTMDTALNDSSILNGKVEKLESKSANSGNGGAGMDITATSHNASGPVAQKAVNDPEASSSNGKPVMVHGTIENDASKSVKAEDSSVNGETVDVVGPRDYNKPVKANNFYGAKTSEGSSSMETEKSVMVGSASEIHKENQVPEQTKPTLDRINLESWEGKGAAKSDQEKNPLLVFLKALVSAFMKVLSE